MIKRDRNASKIRKFYLKPLKVQNVQSHTYCINMYGTIHQNTKGYCTYISLDRILAESRVLLKPVLRGVRVFALSINFNDQTQWN